MTPNHYRNRTPIAVLITLLVSCSPGNWVISKFSDALSAGESTVFTGEDDPELVAEALPFTIKMYESLLEKERSKPRLYLATATAISFYAHAFVYLHSDSLSDSRSDEKRAASRRAKKLFLRARDYALQGLELLHGGITDLMRKGSIDSALAMTVAGDSSYLYWTAVSWLGAIHADRTDLGLAMQSRRAVSLLTRLEQICEHFGDGDLQEILAGYCAMAPISMGGGETKARAHFAKSIAQSEGRKAGPFVTLASTLCIKNRNAAEFSELLETAKAIDAHKPSPYRLQNTINQRRATWLLQNKDRFFGEITPVDTIQK